jgi:V/A-type H+-transporting ATPase subunit E
MRSFPKANEIDMAIEDIIRQIGDDAMAKSDSMLSGARAEAEVVIEKARKSAERFRAEAMQKAEERAKEHARRIETLAGLELRKEILKEKKSHIAEVFEKAENKIANLPSGEYLAFLKPIIIGAVESGGEEIGDRRAKEAPRHVHFGFPG